MTQKASISLFKWRMSRLPFISYLGTLGVCVLAFAFVDFYRFNAGALEAQVWILAVFLLLFLPFVLSMRLRDAGYSPFWPALPLLGLLVLLFQIFCAIASVSGAPGSVPPSNGEKAADYFGFACLIGLGVMTIFAIFPTSGTPQTEALK